MAFHSNGCTVLDRALGYNWGIGVWGYTYLIRLASILWARSSFLFQWWMRNGRYLTLAALGGVYLLRARKERLAASLLTMLVAFIALIHAFAILAGERKWLVRYTLGALSYMILAYMTLILDTRITQLLPWPQADWFLIMPAGLPAWLVTVGWIKARLTPSAT